MESLGSGSNMLAEGDAPAMEAKAELRALGRSLLLVLGGLLLITALAFLLPDGEGTKDPADALGDPDGDSLEAAAFYLLSFLVLTLYTAVTYAAFRLRRRSRHLKGQDATSPTLPKTAYIGFGLAFVYILFAADPGVSRGYWVPVVVALIGGGMWSSRRGRRSLGFTWTLGVALGSATGWYLTWLASGVGAN